jgi:hypothetical protein
MDFLNHREGGMVFYQVFLLSPLQCTVVNCIETVNGCVSLKNCESQISTESCRGYCEYQRGKLLGVLSGFRPRIRPQHKILIFHCHIYLSISLYIEFPWLQPLEAGLVFRVQEEPVHPHYSRWKQMYGVKPCPPP